MRKDLSDLRNGTHNLRNAMHDGFVEVRGKLDGAAAGQQQIVTLLTALIDPPSAQAEP